MSIRRFNWNTPYSFVRFLCSNKLGEAKKQLTVCDKQIAKIQVGRSPPGRLPWTHIWSQIQPSQTQLCS